MITPLGESAFLYQTHRGPTPAASAHILAVARALQPRAAALGVHDIVPSYDSLAVYFNPLTASREAVHAALEQTAATAAATAGSPTPGPQRTHRLAVRYVGPDLPHVAAHARLTESDVIARHTAPLYTVAAIGFLPHFPYLLGLDPALVTPRHATPRPRVPAGTVAIGLDQTGVYPRESPGGWNLIGTTDPDLLLTLEPGDALRFEQA